jgi:hypothetical protein
MVTIVPFKLRYDTAWWEKRLHRLDELYFRETGHSLRCAGYITNGPKGDKRVEAHLLFQTKPRWKVLKRLCGRHIGDIVVTGKYDDDEEIPASWRHKNSRYHRNIRQYVAAHADHPGAVTVWLNMKLPKERRRREMKHVPGAAKLPIVAKGA